MLRSLVAPAPGSGEHTRLACWFWRPAKTNFVRPGPAWTITSTGCEAGGKFASAGHRDQHPGRVCSPEQLAPLPVQHAQPYRRSFSAGSVATIFIVSTLTRTTRTTRFSSSTM